MLYLAGDKLSYYVRKKTRGSFFGFLSMIFLFIVLSNGFYYKSSSTQEYEIMIIGVIILCCIGLYSLTVMQGVNLNKLVSEINITADKFIFTTYPYKWLINIIKPKTIELNRADLNIQEIDFPFISGSKAYRITNGKVRIYICHEYFSKELKTEINQVSPGL